MQLSAPKKITWLIIVIVGLVGILAFIAGIFVHLPCKIVPSLPFFTMLGFFLLTISFILSVLSTALKKM